MSEATWHYATAFEAIAAVAGERPCQIQGDRVVTWSAFDRRADALATDLLEAGLARHATVGVWLHNAPEYLEAYVAAWKVSMVPANVNWRYGAEEVVALLADAEAEAVVFHAAFAAVAEAARPRLPAVRRWYVVADETGPGPGWALPYAEVAGRDRPRPEAPWPRQADDHLLLYTGGTTGLPKGVIWRHDPLFRALGRGGIAPVGIAPVASLAELTDRIAAGGPSLTTVVGSPLMHGTGQLRGLMGMVTGGAIVTVTSRRLDVAELLGAVEATRAGALIVVGQAFGRPLVEHLDANPARYDLRSLRMVISSGAMWSAANKAALLAHVPSAAVFDSLGASEAVGMAIQVTRPGDDVTTGRFTLGPDSAVFTDDGRRVRPGDAEPGLIAIGGNIPEGYRGDPERSARTFRTFEGRRWAVPGDWCRLRSDGSVELLGRGSSCINTAGEKVWPEEVEEALKTRDDVADAIVVGIPDERYGEAVGAIVELRDGAAAPSLEDLAATVRARLAGYKVPRHLVLVDSIGRAPNGKADLPRLRALAVERLSPAAS